MSRHPSTNCRYCGASLSPNEVRLGSVCRNWKCRNQQLNDALISYRNAKGARDGVPNPEHFPPVVVPFSPRPLVPLPSDRRGLFLTYLDGLLEGTDPELPPSVRQAIDLVFRSNDEAETSPQTEWASEEGGLSVCAACRGVCCHDGQEHAFLDRRRVAEVRLASGLSQGELRARYESFLPEVSTKDACVFQAETGCQVPSEMRSHLCNQYECKGLKQATELLAKGVRGVFAAARANNRIEDGTFLVLEESR